VAGDLDAVAALQSWHGSGDGDDLMLYHVFAIRVAPEHRGQGLDDARPHAT
jgi:ribosomal protein S18 acetylase RimI-like enzyme